MMTKIQETREIYCVWTNTDLTEGRGQEYVEYFCEKEATAIRLAQKNYVQGSNSRITKSVCYKINNQWYYPSCRTVYPTVEDNKAEAKLEEERQLALKKNNILNKPKELGLTEEEIKILREV